MCRTHRRREVAFSPCCAGLAPLIFDRRKFLYLLGTEGDLYQDRATGGSDSRNKGLGFVDGGNCVAYYYIRVRTRVKQLDNAVAQGRAT